MHNVMVNQLSRIHLLERQAIIHKTHLSNRKIPTSKHLKCGSFLLLTNKVSTVNDVCQNC